MEIFEGNPFGKKVWDAVWKLDFMKPGTPGISPTSFGDGANVLKGNILQLYGGEPSVDGEILTIYFTSALDHSVPKRRTYR